MHSFKSLKIIVMICVIIIIVGSIFLFRLNVNNFKHINNSNQIYGAIIGNSHAYRIIINSNHVFYMNQDGAMIPRTIEQIKYAKEYFKNLKYIVVNISPIELYRESLLTTDGDNEFIYANNIMLYLKTFEQAVTIPPSYFIKRSINWIELNIFRNNKKLNRIPEGVTYEQNGRQSLRDVLHTNKEFVHMQYFNDIHFFPTREEFSKNIQDIEELLNNNKDLKIVIITMPHHYKFRNYFSEIIKKNNAPSESLFFDKLNKLLGECYINLYSYTLPDKYFFNSDHLNKDGAKYMKDIINKKINQCLKLPNPIQ
ncbi:hypothetical protein [Celerinatantimonas sp. YJH-8]|uniref:hypothetical protein n=1 Tax=Celerinatantimonas sp. YJH-8 TaxID=3228714 RepID=UPI0038C58C74